MSNEIKLTPSQKQLVSSWENELSSFQGKLNSMLNELMLFRLEKIAEELCIDITNEQWTFDFQKKAFIEVKEKQEVTPTIPSKKKKTLPTYSIQDDEVIDVETEDEKEDLSVKKTEEEIAH